MQKKKKKGSENFLKIYNYLKTCFVIFSQSTECLILDICPKYTSGWFLSSLAAVARDFILIKENSEWQFFIYTGDEHLTLFYECDIFKSLRLWW